MLISIVLTLTPLVPGAVPARLGRAVYAEMLRLIGSRDGRVAEEIHAGDGPKAITCSGLAVGEPGATAATGRHPVDSLPVRPGAVYHVRVTGLTRMVTEALVEALIEARPQQITLAGVPFRLLEPVCDARRDPWSGHSDYEYLAGRVLQAGDRLKRSASLEFFSPTAFKSLGMQVPLPLPALVFGSLVERWNTFSPVTLDPGVRKFAEEGIAISRYDKAAG